MLSRLVQLSIVISAILSIVISEDQERFLLDSTTKSPNQALQDLQKAVSDLQHANTVLQKQVNTLNHSLTTKINHLKQAQHTTYIRWGGTTCPGPHSNIIYSGYAAGPPYGEAASSVCLAANTSWANHNDGYDAKGGVLGPIQYHVESNFSVSAFGRNINDGIMPCVVCKSRHPMVVMIPGNNACLQGWIQEYRGFLMGTASFSSDGMEYICVDTHAKTIPIPKNITHPLYSKNVFIVEVRCGLLPCNDFPDGREVTCVVCTK